MKRIFSLICFLVIAAGGVSAQVNPAAWDSTYRPHTYPLLTEQFKGFKHSPSDIVFLGNSITFGIDWYELLELPQVRNRGISGDTTFGLLERLQEVIDGKPAKVFILIGVNDILRGVPKKYTVENYQKMLERLRQGTPKTEIYIQSILPINETFPNRKNRIGKGVYVREVNKDLRKLAKRYQATYIDLYSAFESPKDVLNIDFTYDGLHLNLAGYNRWKEVLEKGEYLKTKSE